MDYLQLRETPTAVPAENSKAGTAVGLLMVRTTGTGEAAVPSLGLLHAGQGT